MDEVLLPDDLTTSPIDLSADLDEVTSFVRRTSIAESGRPFFTRDEVRLTLTMPEVDLSRDSLLVRDRAGEIVGVELVRTPPPFVASRALGFVAPERTGEGIGTYLLRWAAGAARERIVAAPEDACVRLGSGIDPNHQPSVDLLVGEGLTLRRYFLEMRIDFDGAVPDPEYPAGIGVRAFVPGADDLTAYRAMDEAFRDHFGYTERTEEDGLARLRSWMGAETFDASLWWMATDGDQFVGNCWCEGSFEGDDGIGYVGSLGVRKAWRGRGLARALLYEAFREFQRRGKHAATLHVDADSLTGATRLYERVGMRESDRFAAYDTVIRPGVDLEVS